MLSRIAPTTTLLLTLPLASTTLGQVPEDRILPSTVLEPSARFGQSVAVSGDTIVVGASGADTAVIFERVAGQWTRSRTLTGADTSPEDRFGSSVSLAGDWIAIGAPRHRVAQAAGAPLERTGAVYLFTRSGGNWLEVAERTGSDCAESSYFGAALDLQVEAGVARLLVGAPLHDSGPGFGSGAAYVFSNAGGAWSQDARLSAPDAAALDQFGSDVALTVGRAAIGAQADDDLGADSGSVYMCLPIGNTWGVSSKVLPNQGGDSARFGQSLDLDGDRLVVGAPRSDSLPAASGTVHVFEFVTGGWIESASFSGAGVQPGDQFGAGLSLQGNRIVVGAYLQDLSNQYWDTGGAFVFEETAGQWLETRRLISTNSEAQSSLAFSTALDGEVVVLGAPGVDISVSNSGAAYVYDGSSLGPNFCSGDGPSPAGCGTCPCGNSSTSPLPGGCLNSLQQSARLLSEGTPSLQLDSLRLRASGLPPQSFALLVSGNQRLPSNPANPCFGTDSGNSPPGMDGLRCVGGGTLRHGSRPSDSLGETLFGDSGAGLLAGQGFTPGETRHFQIFYRDTPSAGCGTGQNTTQGISITLLP